MPESSLQRSPLDAVHRRLGAKMGAFAGWDMPIEYAGTLAEHRAVRSALGIFDLSHLGKVLVGGTGARDALQHALSNDLDRLAAPGAAQYTLCLTEAGGIADDLLVYREDEGYLLVPNAANWPVVADAVRGSAAELGLDVAVHPRPDLAVIAPQGPASPELVGELFPGAQRLDYLHLATFDWDGVPVRVARSGYTGERGYELYVPAAAAVSLWDALLDRGSALGAVPVGLGARDTLRLEMGYPLHGNDISTATSPIEARLGWAVALRKATFRGREAVARVRVEGPRRLLQGLVATDRAIPRHGMSVLVAGRQVGEVTSGTFSPTRRSGIALAYLETPLAEPATEVVVDVRGRRGGAVVSRPPFVDASPN